MRRVAVVLGTTALVMTAATPAMAAVHTNLHLRVDQGGYARSEPKVAYLMASRRLSSPHVQIANAHGHIVGYAVVTSGPTNWSAAYPAVYRLDLTALTATGRYQLRVTSPARASSPWFRVTPRPDVYSTLLRYGVSFDQVQRDGPDVISGALHRQPAHLNDRHALVYAAPTFEDDSDTIIGPDLTRIGGPIDVSGGWYDAGDYLKLTHSTAYNDVLLFASARALGAAAPPALRAEARYGLRWLSKMWDARHRVLYIQVGIGSGNAAGTFFGDHDIWRLPQADDQDTSHADRYAAAHRPVFAAAPPGHPISPNLAGRVSAAFALAAQADARPHPARARWELGQAQAVYGLAGTVRPPTPLVTALPNAFYPESTWRDDMELGATEIALAAHALHQPSERYLSDARRWAAAYLAHDTGDTFNLYDTSALAHLDLVRALAHDTTAGAVPGALLADVRLQLDSGVQHERSDPFGAAVSDTDFDVDSHTFGLIATEGWYQRMTGDHRYAAFVARQRGWLLGANAWGTSFVVGVGTRFPECMQHQVANLSGSTDGTRPLDVGAVVNGPNGAGQFEGGLGGLLDGMKKCPVAGTPSLRPFDGQGSVFRDDVRAWQTDEPALDMTGAAIAAAAAQLAEASQRRFRGHQTEMCRRLHM